jgi:3-dehydroquinate dehydratase-2
MNILVIHGPNLHLLGKRRKEIYGEITLKELNKILKEFAFKNKINLKIFQSNSEGEIIEIITKNMKWSDFIIINPGAFTHYSYAIRDCIEAVEIPTIEVHLSNIMKRESFRKKSVIKDVCIKQIYGKGINSYIEAINFCLNINER